MARRFDDDARQEALLAAAHHGDLSAVIRYFALPDVRANVAVWNAEDRARRVDVPSPTEHLERPWHSGTRRNESLFRSIVDGGSVKVFCWFFRPEQLEQMGETLRAITDDVLNPCLYSENVATAQEMFEVFVESPLFTEVMTNDERIRMLGRLLSTPVSRGYDQWVSLLLAYGADPNLKCAEATPICSIIYEGTTSTLDLLLHHGAWLEGEDLLTQRAHDRAVYIVCDMVRRGADANAPMPRSGSALHEAAAYCVVEVQVLIDEGFADVDARDSHGRTPLMAVADDGGNARHGRVSQSQIIDLTLHKGADIDAVDNVGHSVLHHAVNGMNPHCLRNFLRRGANPNLQDRNGRTPMATLVTLTNVVGRGKELLEILLLAGADPYIVDKDGVSAVDVLERTDSGREFLQAKRAFFRRAS